jgi:hypothetical protein
LGDHYRDYRFRLPEPVVVLPEREKTQGTWMSEPDPIQAVMMQVPELGGFVRCLLPVRLTGGHSIRFGVWLGVHPNDLRRAFDHWWTSDYPDLVVEGRLANRLPVWDLFGSPARAEVVDANATPCIVSSQDPDLARVLTEIWQHGDVLSAIE